MMTDGVARGQSNGMTAAAERTLTAASSLLGRPEVPSIAALFLCGQARSGAAGKRFHLLGNELLLGRSARADDPHEPGTLRLPDPLVSSRHARLVRTGDELSLEDLGSKNGTFLAGAPVTGRVPLPQGVPFFLGAHVFLWRLVSPLAVEALEEEQARPLGPVATASPELALVLHRLRRWAGTTQEILLFGETGTGKEVYARAVHAASGRAGRFVALNCAALPRELVESELFGYRPGAHSTAHAGKAGLLEEAEGGTLFLDELGEMPPDAQAKLLRFLQDREVVPLGGTRPRRLDVRVLAATNRAVGPGTGMVRDDLLARLGAAPVVLPPLRDRLEDLGALAAHLLARFDARSGFEVPAFRLLFQHAWPLNVRELEKVLGSAAPLAPGRPIAVRDLPAGLGAKPPGGGALPAGESEEAAAGEGRRAPRPGPSRQEVADLLARHAGNVAEVARSLGRQRAAVWRWIKQYGLDPEDHRDK